MSFTSAISRTKPEDALVSDRGAQWIAMQPHWELVEALLGGTPAMREAGHTYLPQYPEEDQDNYFNRLKRTTLTNYFKKSLRTLSAKPFMRPLEIKDLPSRLEPLLTDADKEGNSLHVFAHRSFRTGLSKGLSHILVDFPRTSSPDGTLFGQRNSNAGPYFRHVAPENLIAGYANVINGEEQYTHARIWMRSIQRVAQFGETIVDEILVLEPGVNQLWRLVDSDKEEWVLIDEWETGIDWVPLVTFYADRTAFLEADPPLIDLAHLNVAHWQSSSDQTNVLTVARFPILGASGVTSLNDSDHATPNRHRIGPHQVLTADDPQSRFYYVEHSGNAIQSGREHLLDLKDEMAMLGMELVMRGTRASRVTATAHAIDKAEADTALSQMAVDYEEALNQALRYANAWFPGEDRTARAGTAALASDFGLSMRDVEEVGQLMTARQNGYITHDTLLRELKRRAVLSDDFDIALEIQRLGQETPPAPRQGGPAPTGPGQPNPDPPLRAAQ